MNRTITAHHYQIHLHLLDVLTASAFLLVIYLTKVGLMIAHVP
ncbi:unnamed protein product [Brugia timori]|uniref:Uncharacterized protein n=1 Tax=Brugia timori TaxID=42155 RepID=A0A3P7WNQ7_9BILA|nr:unnamed protein product [Brugia timori]